MICEICQCDPCDCWDIMGYSDEFWGMVPTGTTKTRQDNELVGQENKSTPEYPDKMEEGNPASNRTFPPGLHCTCNYTGTADIWDNYIGSPEPGDKDPK